MLILLVTSATGPVVHAEAEVPPLRARVTDLTGTLTPTQRATLEARLKEFERRKGSQIAVLLVPSTKPEAIEQYSIRVLDQWKLGRKNIDDGLLLLVAKNDRKIRIEVGYGLEGTVPDATARRIVAEIIAPYFKRGDFGGGIEAGVARLIRLVDGEPLPPPQKRPNRFFGLDDLGWIGLIVLLMFGGLMRAWFGPLLGAGATGGLAGGLTWLLVGSPVIAGSIGFLVFILALLFGSSGRGGSSGAWSSGGWSSGGSDWGSSSGSDFGGGGGDFGGGGASGDW